MEFFGELENVTDGVVVDGQGFQLFVLETLPYFGLNGLPMILFL